MQQKNFRGFTLIELLVVISIIGILSSFAMVSLNNARNKARDALRKADMAQTRTAIMLYYDDNNRYPVCGTWKATDPDFGADVGSGSACYNSTLKTALTGGVKPVLSPMPEDPSNKGNEPAVDGGSDTYLYRYVSKSDGSEYALVYQIEENNVLQVIRGY